MQARALGSWCCDGPTYPPTWNWLAAQITGSSHPTPWLQGIRLADIPKAGQSASLSPDNFRAPWSCAYVDGEDVGAIFHTAWGQFWIVHISLSFVHVPSRVLAVTHEVTGIKEHLAERCRYFPAPSWSEQSDPAYTLPCSCLYKGSLNNTEQKTPS